MPRITVGFTTSPRSTARSSVSRLKPVDARPEPDVRRRRPLRLHAGEALDRGQHADLLALEQQLPRERRAVQLLQRQDALCHGMRRNSTEPPVTIANSATLTGCGSSSKRSYAKPTEPG